MAPEPPIVPIPPEVKFKALIEHTSDCISLLTKELVVTYDSPAVAKVLGYLPGENIGKNAIEFFHPDERDRVYDLLKEVLSKPGVPLSAQFRLKTKSGKFVWIEGVVTNLLDTKEVGAIYANYRDITDRKSIEDQLRLKTRDLEVSRLWAEESRARDLAILESMGEGVVATDAQNRVLSWNNQMELMLGYKSKEVLGKNVIEFIYAQDEDGKEIPNEKRVLNLAYKKISKVQGTYFYKTRAGKFFPVLVTSTPYLLAGKVSGAVSIIRDITHEREVELAKNEFVALVSHELRTPLTVLRWHSKKLLNDFEGLRGNETAMKSLAHISEASLTMGEIIEAILTVSKLDLNRLEITLKPVDIIKVIKDVVAEFSLQISNKQTRMVTDFSEHSIMTNVDPTYAQIILQNLISNAIKYTPQKGVIRITIKKETASVVVSITDTGMGIPDEEKSKVFTKLFRAKNARAQDPSGIGLGLYISKVVSQRMGGDLWFESNHERGTTFFVRMPVSNKLK